MYNEPNFPFPFLMVDDEIRVDNRVVQIWKVKFDHHLSFCSDFEHKVSRFGQDFEVDVQARF